MFVILTGVPGSGKTYYAVYQIWEKFIKKSEYKSVFTNINQFNFAIKENLFDIKNFSDIKKHISKAHEMFLQGASDTEINNYLSQFHLTNSLIVLDEAQIYFDKDDKDLIFWLTYHRHFFQDIILITQNILLIHYKYRKIAEYFIKAKQRSLALTRSFTYNFFLDENFNERVNVVKLPYKKEVFALYQSGDAVRSKNFLKFWLLIALALFVLLFILWRLFMSFFPSAPSNSLDVNNSKIIHTSEKKHYVNKNFDKTFLVSCSRFNCYYNNSIFPFSFVQSLALKGFSVNRVTYFYVPVRYKNFFERKENEKNDFNLSNLY